MEESVRYLMDNSMRNNLQVIWIPGEEKENKKKIALSVWETLEHCKLLLPLAVKGKIQINCESI